MFSVLGKLKWFFLEHKKRYIIAVSCLILASIADVLPPKLIGLAIDAITYEQAGPSELANLLLIYGGIIVFSYIISFVWVYLLFGGAYLVERMMRTKLMGHLLQMNPTFFGKYRTGDLMARATNDLKAISATAGFGILTLVDSTVFMMLIIGVMVFTISWKLTLVALIPLPFMAIVMHKYGKTIHERFMRAQTSFGDLNDYVLESVRGVRVLRAFVQEKEDEKRFREHTEDVYTKNVAVAKIDAMFEPTMKVLVGLSYTIGLGYGAQLVFQNELTLGGLVSFNVYLGMLIWPMFAVGELINVMQRGNASLDRVNETLSYPADVRSPEHPVYINLPEILEFKDLDFVYPESQMKSVSNVTLTVKRGETIGVVGKTGAGKTTLFRQMLREYPRKNHGELLINGVPIEKLSLDQTRSWIGYVPQDQILFSKSVLENIRFGKSDASREEVNQVLGLSYLRQDVELLPEGLDTQVGESGVTLSGGQKQRLALARALIMDPEILILDDAMSAVDGKTEANIIANLRKERKGKTTFIAAHRLSAVEHADQIIVLEEGKIVEHGTHEQLIAHGGWYAAQYQLQQLEDQEVV
ncbi:ABC transporter ATP-binding protein [Bacillaceae bacterium S4-13-58]